jgi:hypothetical protein
MLTVKNGNRYPDPEGVGVVFARRSPPHQQKPCQKGYSGLKYWVVIKSISLRRFGGVAGGLPPAEGGSGEAVGFAARGETSPLLCGVIKFYGSISFLTP